MAWTDPRTWVVGELTTAANMNAHIRDNMNMLWRELAYVEFTSSVSVTTASTEGSPLDVVSSGTLTYVATPIVIEFFAPGLSVNTASSGGLGLNLWDGSTDLGRLINTNTQSNNSVTLQRRLTPTAASHTYKIRASAAVNTQQVIAGAGGVATFMPGFIRVTQQGSA